MGKGNKSTQSGKQTIVNELPEYARPFYENLMKRTEAESLNQYTPYEGQRLAQSGDIADIAESRDIVRNVAGSGIQGLDEAMGATRGAMGATQGVVSGLDTLRGDVRSASQYDPSQFSQFQFDPARQFTGDEVSQYMSPYMDAVVERQKQGAIQDFQRGAAGRAASAVKAGAFGGSRQAVADYLAEEGLGDRLADIEATGRQQAFQQAAQQFGADRAAQMQQQQAQAGELGRVQSAQEMANQFAQQQQMAGLGQEAGMLGQQAGLASQYAQLGTGLAGLGGQQRAADIQGAQLLEGIGKQQLGEQQAGLDIGYQDFLRQQGFNKEQLGFMSNILQGVPVQPNQTTTQYQPYNPLQQALGAGIAGLGLYRGMV
jgi:hypothetical protein